MSLSIAVEFFSLQPVIFPQTVMWPFMLAVLDHPGLAYLEPKLCFKNPIFDTNKKTHKRYHLLFQGKLASHILATD